MKREFIACEIETFPTWFPHFLCSIWKIEKNYEVLAAFKSCVSTCSTTRAIKISTFRGASYCFLRQNLEFPHSFSPLFLFCFSLLLFLSPQNSFYKIKLQIYKQSSQCKHKIQNNRTGKALPSK